MNTLPINSPMMEPPKDATGAIVFADGTIFFGQGAGIEGITGGEICFNTSMTGYQEILTDPSYAGQIITFTFPEIGVVGANKEDFERVNICAKGCIIRNPLTKQSSWRAEVSLNDWLIQHQLVAVTGVDTRAITRYIRKNGAQNVALIHEPRGNIRADILIEMARNLPPMQGTDLASQVTRQGSEDWQQKLWDIHTGYQQQKETNGHIVAIDYGAKDNILRCLSEQGCKITVVPATTSANDILELKPDGIFLSNGPGDPAATAKYSTPTIQELIKTDIPIFGICLGNQLLALALGGKTQKMQFGHRGANHPVRNNQTGVIEITSQNHGFVVERESLPSHVEETHTSLFDGSVEGIAIKGKNIFTVQYHPEASPGPHDSIYLFDKFGTLVREYAKSKGA
ncbi:MAG: glutamine-hydrolyzing carbamoyl-phosphate synthase small subunit [Alphaproteobacteria bacterium]